MSTVLLVDGNALMHRAYHALPLLSNKDGKYTNVPYGFLSILLKVITELHPTHIGICFDTPKPTFRDELLPEYRAQRPKADDTFIQQISLTHELVDKAGLAKLLFEGFEADDVIGTMARRFKKNHEVYILTGDKDLMQLVDDHTFILSPSMGISSTTIYDKNAVKQKLGVEPELIPDLKALMGDASDNYKGAKGIGPKTAIKLLIQFHSVENLLEHTDQIVEPRIRTLVESNKDNIRLSKQLALLHLNVPIEIPPEKLVFNGLAPSLNMFLQDLGINSLRKKIFFEEKKPQSTAQMNLF